MEKSKYVYCTLGVFLITYIFYPYGNTKNWHNVVRQPNSYSCGYSCLRMVFNHYGIVDDFDEMQKKTTHKNWGTTFLNLKRYADKKGLHARAWKQSIDHLSINNQPSILLINNSHFVVLDSIKNDIFYIRDPLKGNIFLHKKELNASWAGYILTFGK